MRHVTWTVFSSLLLAGCGGGGGGGASVIAEWLGTDPNAVIVTSTGKTYNLTHGSKDPEAADIVTLFFGPSGTNTSVSFPSAYVFAGHTLSGQSSLTSGFTLTTPSNDVKAAWKAGWTGLNQNVLMIDGYPDPVNKPSSMTQEEYEESFTHGITTALLVARYAPNATFYGIDGNDNYDSKIHNIAIINNNSVPLLENNQTSTHPGLVGSTRQDPGFYFDVVNISMGYNYWAENIVNPTQQQVDQAFADQAIWTGFIAQNLNGAFSGDYGLPGSAAVVLTDAVVSKAAGNDSIDTKKDPLSYVLAHDASIGPRLLIVGALDTNGEATFVNKPGTATIASYSNIAGTDADIANRFLVASGHTPYISTDLAIDGKNIDAGTGTSYAAPRVAGYATILRQKFPNLTGANTADLLLQTARYDTLTCNPNCDKAVYGQGEASLSHAMSPVGALK